MILPYQDRFSIQARQATKITKGFDGIAHTIKGEFKNYQAKKLDDLWARALQISENQSLLARDSDGKIKLQITKVQAQYNHGGEPDRERVDQLLTLYSEAAKRTLSISPYLEQLMGAILMHQGKIAEMATGEGKSLTAAMSAAILASSGLPVHVVTANDYLAQRDAELMKPFFDFVGQSVGTVNSESPPNERAIIYQKSVVYTTAKELLGDYLRDRLKAGDNCTDLHRAVQFTLKSEAKTEQLTQRGLYAAVVDEADNVLIDEAVTPLILSTNRENNFLTEATFAAHQAVNLLEKGSHYHVALQTREIRWTPNGQRKLTEIAVDLPRLWQGHERCREIMTFALQAKELFNLDEHYIIDEEKIILIDILTGRLTPNRNLGIGLQQAVEVSEELEPSPPTETIARFSFQRFFRLFPLLGGMSGTVKEAAGELWKIYNVPVVSVPCHKPIIRKNLPWKYFQNQDSKLSAIIAIIKAYHETGQPVLVGSRTVDVSAQIADTCRIQGIKCNLLNAVYHKEEAEIVAEAGQLGAVTIATNMAGRGTDIKLGKGVTELGGLLVISVEPQTSGRLDRQLFGRSGRQGDPGSVLSFVSAEDLLLKGFTPFTLRFLIKIFVRPEGKVIDPLLKRFIYLLQYRAERLAARRRTTILEGDDWLDEYLSFPGSIV